MAPYIIFLRYFFSDSSTSTLFELIHSSIIFRSFPGAAALSRDTRRVVVQCMDGSSHAGGVLRVHSNAAIPCTCVGSSVRGQLRGTTERNLVIPSACDKKKVYLIASEIHAGPWKKTFVYFTDDERKLVDQAAEIERRSVSSFVANAALTAAETTVRKNSIKS